MLFEAGSSSDTEVPAQLLNLSLQRLPVGFHSVSRIYSPLKGNLDYQIPPGDMRGVQSSCQEGSRRLESCVCPDSAD